MYTKIVAAAMLVLGTSLAWAGPLGKYYAATGGGRSITVVQGSSIINAWAAHNGCEWALNVYGDVRTNPAGQGCGAGAQYTLAGAYTGVNYNEEIGGYTDTDDSTTDGTYNYTVAYSTGQVIRTDRNFVGATTLFSTERNSLGITFDETNISLWIVNFGGSVLRNYDLSGNLLSSFTLNANASGGLALDHLDQSLWYVGEDGLMHQYSKAGAELSTGPYLGYVLGGEFDFADAGGPVPEPATLSLLGLGLAGLGLSRRGKSFTH